MLPPTHQISKGNSTDTSSSDTKKDGHQNHLQQQQRCHHHRRPAYLTLLSSFLIFYSSFGLMSTFGFFQDFYTQHFLPQSSHSSIAFIGTIQMALTNLMAAVSGALCDKYGVNYLYICSGTGTTLSLLLLSFTAPGRFWSVFLIQGVLMGLSISFAVQPALTVVAQNFSQHRALAMGFVTTGSALGGIAFPVLLGELLPRVGFAVALRVAAGKVVICYLITLLISIKTPSGKSDSRRKGGGGACLLDFRGFMDLRYAVLCVGTWFAVLGLWLPAYYIKTYADDVYPGNNISKYFLCMINGCSIVGAILTGLLADHLGRLSLLWPSTLLSSLLTLFLWLLSPNMPTLILFACAYGLTASSITALPPAIISQITPEGQLGARTGAFYSVIAISSLVGTPIGGVLVREENAGGREGYRWLILFSGTALLVGSTFMLAVRLLHGRELRHSK